MQKDKMECSLQATCYIKAFSCFFSGKISFCFLLYFVFLSFFRIVWNCFIQKFVFETFIFSAMRNFELLDLGFFFNSSCEGIIGFFVITFKSFFIKVPYKSFSCTSLKFPFLKKFFTILSSSE